MLRQSHFALGLKYSLQGLIQFLHGKDERQRERQRQRQRETERDRETERQRDRARERDRETDTERERNRIRRISDRLEQYTHFRVYFSVYHSEKV